MASEIGVRSIDYSEESMGKDLGLLLREQRRQQQQQEAASERERERGLDIFRSGSAPPTVEGSLSAVGGLFSHHGDVWSSPQSQLNNCNKREISDEELRSDPAYVNYYYSNVNLNPRLPPPLMSKEDWRYRQRIAAGAGGGDGGGGVSVLGGIGDRRKMAMVDDGSGDRSLFSAHPGFNGQKEENGVHLRRVQNEWGGDGLIGLPGLGLGSRQKSIAEFLQDDLNQATSISRHPSRPASRCVYDENSTTSEGGSLSRSTTPDPHLIARAPSPRIPPVGEGKVNAMDKRSASGPGDSADIVSALSGIHLSADHTTNEEKHLRSKSQRGIGDQTLFNLHGDHNHSKKNSAFTVVEPGTFNQHVGSLSAKGYGGINKGGVAGMDRNNYYMRTDGQFDHHKAGGARSPSSYHNVGSPSSAIPNYSLSGHNINPALASMMAGQLGSGNMPLLFENNAAAAAMGINGMDARVLGGVLPSGANLMAPTEQLHNLSRMGHHSPGSGVPVSLVDPMYLHYLRSPEYAAGQLSPLSDPIMEEGNSYMDLLALQKAYLGTLLSPQKSDFGSPYGGKSGGMNHGYYGNQALGLGMPYGGNPLATLLPNSPMGTGTPGRHNERGMRLSAGMRNLAGGVMGGWSSEAGSIMEQGFGSSLLDEFKSNKTKCFELSEIDSHVVEFSADQYGSRFIQQKLETATSEEKNMVFREIMPQALSLMTDVFGNYVIQKFFEHGSASQIRELADKLTGHVLTLSLQMYGCRVIQKAIEVVDLDQQKNMVTELDGHIMRCVRDQNGNHVIQKCIECIPEDAIQFIVSTFYDQVVTLSTHPYGCRVIQRILEHCSDKQTQQIVMDEIMQSVCMLAQDQYGNYVVQHVLEHGKPDERSAILNKLSGKIVQMSQQKFASNVIEKCLTFGDPVERRNMVNEMLGSTDENEPLQVMMKDQFGNYVVQKVLETCDDQQLELILARIKIHLNALKKYTYGKHIVARVEKLVAAGEKRIISQSAYAAAAAAAAAQMA